MRGVGTAYIIFSNVVCNTLIIENEVLLGKIYKSYCSKEMVIKNKITFGEHLDMSNHYVVHLKTIYYTSTIFQLKNWKKQPFADETNQKTDRESCKV